MTKRRQGPDNRVQYRGGITLLEVLTVIALIGILLAIFVPAVQQARGTSRRTQCANKLRQIGLAIHNFESSEQEFPGGHQWRIQLLPYLDESALFQQFQSMFKSVENGPTSSPPWALDRQVNSYVCPSDPQSSGEIVNYYGNMSSGLQQFGFNGVIVPPPDGAFRMGAVNTLHTAGPTKARDVIDGLSNTVAVSEAIAGARPQPPMRQANNASRPMLLSTFWQLPSELPNATNFFDRVNYCAAVVDRQATSVGGERGWDTWPMLGEDGFVRAGPIIHGWAYEHALGPNSPSCGNSYYGVYSASSMHRHVVNALFADGAVTPMSQGIDTETWRALASRARGEARNE